MELILVPDKVHRLWNEWNLHGAVLFSLFLQVWLIFSAPSRKRTKNRSMMIWLAYLHADWVAVFAFGLISSNSSEGPPKTDKLGVNKDLAAFWSPFLLLHLGGPDTITAFSQEDNELWLRHLLGLVFQLGAVVYVISQSIPNELLIPTLFLFIAGAIKYVERTCVLFSACLGNFKDVYSIPEITCEKEVMSDLEVVEYGNMFFKAFRGVIIDNLSSEIECSNSRRFMLERTWEDAFRIIEVELNFMYDVVYTKMFVLHNKIGYVFRLVCYALVAPSFKQFRTASHHYKVVVVGERGGTNMDIDVDIDIGVTYTLLIGAVGLDLVSFLMVIIFSDWTLVSVVLLEERNTITPWVKSIIIATQVKSIVIAIRKRLIPILLMDDKRWCQSVSQFNLITYSLTQPTPWLDKVADFFRVRDFLDAMRYVKTQPVKDDLKKFIFAELRKKVMEAKWHRQATSHPEAKWHREATSHPEAKWHREATPHHRDIRFSKGNWTVSQYESGLGHDCYSSIVGTLREPVKYDESLLMWHIATELCYSSNDPENDDHHDLNREYCKILSDYMLCLLVMQQPTLILLVGKTLQLKYKDTCDAIKAIILDSMSQLHGPNSDQEFNNVWCSNILLNPDARMLPSGDKSVLVDALELARVLVNLEDKKMRWEMMARVWVELLCFGASHCRERTHAQRLSHGGELITLVWLLMAHFGIGEQLVPVK